MTRKICHFLNDMLHNLDGPAVTFESGHKLWYIADCLIKEEYPDGTTFDYFKEYTETTDKSIKFFNYNKLHKLNEPAIHCKNGDKYYYQYGKLHRENGPAIELSTGEKRWFYYGLLHNSNGPAIDFGNGYYEYYYFGKLHRENGPAIVTYNKQCWYIFGQKHREDGPAVIYENGDFEYYLYNQLHRKGNFPAILYDNKFYYYKFNQLHRENGPAIHSLDGTYQKWYQNDTLHRENNLPAVIKGLGYQEWFYEGRRHRIGGPSIYISNEKIISHNMLELFQSSDYNPNKGYLSYYIFGKNINKNKMYLITKYLRKILLFSKYFIKIQIKNPIKFLYL